MCRSPKKIRAKNSHATSEAPRPNPVYEKNWHTKNWHTKNCAPTSFSKPGPKPGPRSSGPSPEARAQAHAQAGPKLGPKPGPKAGPKPRPKPGRQMGPSLGPSPGPSPGLSPSPTLGESREGRHGRLIKPVADSGSYRGDLGTPKYETTYSNDICWE